MFTTVRRSEITTTDRDMAAQWATAIAPHRHRVTLGDPAAVGFQLATLACDSLTTHTCRTRGMDYQADADTLHGLTSSVVLGGRIEATVRGQRILLTEGDGMLYPPDTPIRCDFSGVGMVSVVLPFQYAADIAEAATGVPGKQLRFESLTPVSEAMRAHWARTVAFVNGQLDGADELPALIVEQLQRTAAAGLLGTFPNTAMTAREVPAGRVAPAAVRRALAFMDENPRRPVTVTEVAAVAGVGARALQEAFRRHLDTTPLAYLRRVRLERVRDELRAATPGSGTTVKDTARSWGFANPGRFTAEYREAFGTLPSHTLHQG